MTRKMNLFLVMGILIFHINIYAQTFYLSEDFESYQIGTFPSSGGWVLIYSGWGTSYQTIDNSKFFSGTRSLKLEGRANWAATVSRSYVITGETPKIIYYEFKVNVNRLENPIMWYSDFRLWAGSYGGSSHAFASIDFVPDRTDGKEYLMFNNYKIKGPEVQLGKWYKIKIEIDLENDQGSVWLDDVLIISKVSLGSNNNFKFEPAITIEGGNDCHTRIWIDDISIYSLTSESFLIAFTSDRESTDGRYHLWLMNSDKTGLIKLTNFPAPWQVQDLIFTNDGNWIIFRKEDDPNMARSEIWKIDKEGKNLMVINNPGSRKYNHCIPLNISPNDEFLLFSSEQSNNNGWFKLWRVNLDGTNASIIEDYGNAPLGIYSLDGKKIVYANSVDWYLPSSIGIMNSDLSNKNIILNRSYWPANYGPLDNIAYTIDNKIVFSIGPFGGKSDIYIMNADGSNLKKLVETQGDDKFGRWRMNGNEAISPDGKNLVFYSDISGNYEIYLINLDGSGMQRLTENNADDRYAAFSPDGSKIIWISNITGTYSLWMMDKDGSNKIQLTDNMGNEKEFTVVKGTIAQLKSLKLNYPNGGENLIRGSTYEILWSSEGIEGELNIYLIKDENTIYTIAKTDISTERYTWQVPSDIALGNNYKIKISIDEVYDESDNYFSISGITDNSPSVKIKSPADGSKVYGTVTIEADAYDDKGITKVEFYISDLLKNIDTDYPYQYQWDSSNSIGLCNIKVIAYDTANQEAEAQINVYVDQSLEPPYITNHPQSQTIRYGEQATLTVEASGGKPLSYQWYKGATGNTSNPISGATSNVYVTPAITGESSFWVRVSNPNGFADSKTAIITIVKQSNLEGYVYETGTMRPISGASLVLENHSSVTSNANGYYSFSNINPGNYKINISKTGYMTITQNISIPPNSTITKTFYLSPVTSTDVKISSLACKYSGFVYYLNGIDFPVDYTATIDWGNNPPGKINFITPKANYEISLSGNSVTKRFNIATDFSPYTTLKAVAISANGIKSKEYEANFMVIPPPPLVGLILRKPVDLGDSFYYKTEVGLDFDFIDEKIKEGAIPKDIPYFGEKGFSLRYIPTLEMTAKSSGEVSLSASFENKPLKNKEIKGMMAGFEFSLVPKLNLYGQFIKGENRYKWKGMFGLSGNIEVSKSWPFLFTLGPIPVPMFLKGTFRFGADASLSIENLTPLTLNGMFDLNPYIRGMVAAGVDNVIYAGGWIGGGAEITFQYPREPNLAEFNIYLNGGIQIYALGLKWENDLLRWDWSLTKSTTIISGMDKLMFTEPKLVNRDYLFSPDSGKFFNRPDFSLVQSLSRNSTMEVKSAKLQSSIFPYPESDIDFSGSNGALVWLVDDPVRTALNRTKAISSFYDGVTWTDPIAISDDGTADFHPQIITFNDGSAVSAWEDANKVFLDSDSFNDVLKALEISVASYDPNRREWALFRRMTLNSYLDRSPLISGPTKDKVMLIWIANEFNNLRGNETAPNKLYFSIFNGSEWSQPQLISHLPYGLIKYNLLYDGNNAYIIMSVDTDNDMTTIADHELFLLTFRDGLWSEITRLTQDNLPDENPHLSFTWDGNVMLVWLKGNEIYSCLNFHMEQAYTVLNTEISTNLADFKLAVSDAGNMAIVWTEPSNYGSDIFALFYDREKAKWGVSPKQLTDDSESESYLTTDFFGESNLFIIYARNKYIESLVRTISEKEMSISIYKPTFIGADLYLTSYIKGKDLALKSSSLKVFPENPVPGEGVTFTVTAINMGDEPAPSVPVVFYLGDPSGGGKKIGEVFTPAMLLAGEAVDLNLNWEIPATTSPLVITAVIDPEKSYDNYTGNNKLSIEIVKPDLLIEEIKLEGATGNKLLLNARIKNNGSITSGESSIKIKKDSTTGPLFQEGIIPALSRDEIKDISFILDVSGYPTNEITIYLILDEENRINEYLEDNNISSFTISLAPSAQPIIKTDKTILYFGGTVAGTRTSPQNIVISNTGEGNLNWTATVDQSWIKISPSSGVNSGIIQVNVDPSGLREGLYNGKIYISDPVAANSPQIVSVVLLIKTDGKTEVPFGFFDTPTDGASLFGSVPVTGWALDDIEVTKVEIKRSPHPLDDPVVIGPDGLVYIGDAVFVEGARPDVAQLYPTYPLNYRAGWGYMMLTNFLPNQGNGTFTIHAIAYDKEGQRVSLGSKTIYCDNANATPPFGTIDTPGQGATVSGSSYINFGWALTPQPKMIPTNGSTIWVWVDGVPLGHPVYNQYRSDIATLFPGYKNSNGAVGYYYLDTTKYANGVHTIAWSVRDDAGSESGIGSRYFTVLNLGTSSSLSNLSGQKQGITSVSSTPSFSLSDSSPYVSSVSGYSRYHSYREVMSLPVDFSPILYRTGYSLDAKPEAAVPDPYGVVEIRIKEVERIEVYLGGEEGYREIEGEKKSERSREKDLSDIGFNSGNVPADLRYSSITSSSKAMQDVIGRNRLNYYGYLIVGNELKPLPIGSTLDSDRGIFYWQPGPGFLGPYDFVFIKEGASGFLSRTKLRVIINPKF